MPAESLIKAVRLAVRLTVYPNAELKRIGQESPGQGRILKSFLLPLALIPALSWCLGLQLSGEAMQMDWIQIVHRGAVVYFGTLMTIYLLAASIYVLGPLFSVGRVWGRAFQVAAYSSAPLMLAGLVLVLPVLAFAMLVAACHSFYLQYVGVSSILGAKEEDAAEYVALVVVMLSVLSTLLGAFGSWLGVL